MDRIYKVVVVNNGKYFSLNDALALEYALGETTYAPETSRGNVMPLMGFTMGHDCALWFTRHMTNKSDKRVILECDALVLGRLGHKPIASRWARQDFEELWDNVDVNWGWTNNPPNGTVFCSQITPAIVVATFQPR